MNKTIKKGKVVNIPLNDSFSALHFDNNNGGIPIYFLFVKEGIYFEEGIFEPYLGKTISITIEKDNGKIKRMIIGEEK